MALTEDFRHALAFDTKVVSGAFESVVGRMAQMGWEFETVMDTNYQDMLVRFRNPVGLVTATVRTNMFRPMQFRGEKIPYLVVQPDAILEARVFKEVHMPQMDWQPADVVMTPPAGINYDVGLELFTPFAKDKPKEIIAEPKTVAGLLAEIEAMQKPRAKEILANERKRGEMEELHLEAKILSFK